MWPTAVDVADGLEFSKAWDRQKGGKAQTPKGLGVGRRVQECSLVSSFEVKEGLKYRTLGKDTKARSRSRQKMDNRKSWSGKQRQQRIGRW